jgi:UDPglucose 6-dehydrogenase
MDADKIAKLQRGEMPIYEPHLTELLREASARGGIEFTTELAPAAAESDVIFIAVGTPPRPSGKRICRIWNRQRAASGPRWMASAFAW